jgi:hypothetical protein
MEQPGRRAADNNHMALAHEERPVRSPQQTSPGGAGPGGARSGREPGDGAGSRACGSLPEERLSARGYFGSSSRAQTGFITVT